MKVTNTTRKKLKTYKPLQWKQNIFDKIKDSPSHTDQKHIHEIKNQRVKISVIFQYYLEIYSDFKRYSGIVFWEIG
jgi:hypothetical protein